MPSGFTYTCGDFLHGSSPLGDDGNREISSSPPLLTIPSARKYLYIENQLDVLLLIEVYIYLWGSFPHGSSPFGDDGNREISSSPHFLPYLP